MDQSQTTSSPGMMMMMQDDHHQRNLNTKYQKLAAEYAKLRSQVQVLKKAVVEEQQQKSQLKEQLTSQDQSLRKLEQELDSVKFRNRQLEKRIEVLQSDVVVSSPPVPAAHQSSSQPSSNLFLDQNLLLHIEQNKQLQESLALLNEKYNTETSRLKRMIDQELVPKELLESLKQEHHEKLNLMNKRIKELCNQNNELMDKLNCLEMERCSRNNEESDQSVGGGGGGSSSSTTTELVKKLGESEVEREKLSSEVQILRLKLKRWEQQQQQQQQQGVVTSSTSACTEDPKSPTTPITTETMIGKMEQITTVPANDTEYQAFLSSILSTRNNELIKLLQLTDSKAIYYYHEAMNLCRLVRTCKLSYKRLDSEFNKLKVKYRGVQDELEDIKSGYEGQVNSLTEHIAILNEKLAGMVEEIGVLRGSSGGGGGKR